MDRISSETAAAGTQLELSSLMAEYQNQFDRSNKLDNKVYITITFCGFLFVFITGLFNGLSQLSRPASALQLLLSCLYILGCVIVMAAYVFDLVFFMRLLQPERISRMDPDILAREHFEEMPEEDARRRLISLYRETVNENLEKLHRRCDEFVRGLRFIVPTVLAAFLCYVLQILLQIAA